MFRLLTEDEYEAIAGAGARPLFTVGPFAFLDTMDGDGRLHHVVMEESGAEEADPVAYEADQPTMYELVARYLAGVYEKDRYELDTSPAHMELLDVLELAGARARSGGGDFSLAELDLQAEEVYGEDDPEA